MIPPTRRSWSLLTPTLFVGLIVLIYMVYNDMIPGTADSFQSVRIRSSREYNKIVKEDNEQRPELFPPDSETPINNDITIVSAFLGLDTHSVDMGPEMADPYNRWMKWSVIFRNITNPVVIYLGSVQYMFYFEYIRGRRTQRNTNMTIVNVSDMEINNLRSKMEKNLPNSGLDLNVDKLMQMHAKYELLRRAAIFNPFRTSHFLWMDSADFTDMAPNVHPFKLHLPNKFNDSNVAYRTEKAFKSKKVEKVFKEHDTFVDGDFILGATKTVIEWCNKYLEALKKYLDAGFVGTDETTLYAMATDSKEHYKDSMVAYNENDKNFKKWAMKITGLKTPFKLNTELK